MREDGWKGWFRDERGQGLRFRVEIEARQSRKFGMGGMNAVGWHRVGGAGGAGVCVCVCVCVCERERERERERACVAAWVSPTPLPPI